MNGGNDRDRRSANDTATWKHSARRLVSTTAMDMRQSRTFMCTSFDREDSRVESSRRHVHTADAHTRVQNLLSVAENARGLENLRTHVSRDTQRRRQRWDTTTHAFSASPRLQRGARECRRDSVVCESAPRLARRAMTEHDRNTAPEIRLTSTTSTRTSMCTMITHTPCKDGLRERRGASSCTRRRAFRDASLSGRRRETI